MDYLTIGTLWKDEDDYALDFVNYHKKVGVERFIILDREFNRVKSLFKDDPSVEVVHFPEPNLHADAWAHLIGMGKGRTKWLACIDADECLVPVQTNDVKEILKKYEEFASLQINWRIFGSGGQDFKNTGSLYERFLMASLPQEGVNNHTQFICQPDRTMNKRTHDPHHPIVNNGEFSVNTNRSAVKGPFNKPPLHDVLWCAHYITKSREEWAFKNSKGRADIFGQKMPFEMYDLHNAVGNAVEERRVLELWNSKNI